MCAAASLVQLIEVHLCDLAGQRIGTRPDRVEPRAVKRRPVPFDTYHTTRDTLATLDGRALDAVVQALEALVVEAATARPREP